MPKLKDCATVKSVIGPMSTRMLVVDDTWRKPTMKSPFVLT